MHALARLLRPALRGMRANLVPGLVLQAFALLIVVAYFELPHVGVLLDRVGALKQQHGYAFSAISTALFGGLIPYCVLWLSGAIPRSHAGRELLFYVAFWLWKGVEVDALYRGQAMLLGDGAAWTTVATKTALDQFVYNPLWAAPSQTLFFLWKDRGFSWHRTRASLREDPFWRRTLTVLLSTWVVWTPAVAIIYALPGALQVPLFNVVLCFWCLLLSFLSRDERPSSTST